MSPISEFAHGTGSSSLAMNDSAPALDSIIEFPWQAWSADTLHRLHLPAGWTAHVLRPHDAKALSADQIAQAIKTPIETPTLNELARGRKRACIVVDDLSRPTRASEILPHVLSQVEAAGIAPSAICMLVATGTHGRLNEKQIAWKVGDEIASAYRVLCHDAQGDLAPTGLMFGDRELCVNRVFMESDLRIAIGATLPHPFAGFSGGAKSILPGLADLAATARSHKFVRMGLRGGADPNTNRFRTEAEQLVERLGIDFVVSVVPNTRRETAGVFAGNLVNGHRAACRFATEIYATTFDRSYDCLVLNAYPKDNEFVQSEAAFVVLKGDGVSIVRDGGVIVLTLSGTNGVGEHGLFAPGGVSYRVPQPKRALGTRELWIYSPGCVQADMHKIYWDGYPVFRDSTKLKNALARRFLQPTEVAVLPCGPMQQLVHETRWNTK